MSSSIDRSAEACASRASGVRSMSLLRECTLERPAQQDDQPRRRACAHQAHAPDLSGERTEAGADLDVVLVEQVDADRRLVYTLRYTHRVQRPQAIALRREQRQPQLRDRSHQTPMIALVARPP